MLVAFSRDSCVSVISASLSTCTVCYSVWVRPGRRKKVDWFLQGGSAALSEVPADSAFGLAAPGFVTECKICHHRQPAMNMIQMLSIPKS